ncbi:L,D-transpeptidase-like protein [Prosthecobacter fusiformis]|uniref:L,D-transpeptidase-like protein n=1 Tax=Prosthecobacter fusiformis TaxID=48464 RepID=A0A4V6Q582_9BACT|nr:L,D-transpeptidase family protein [Prosthecobacter fusiformis]TDU63090.1 L,D-transpeptidase-like protein [Prosthecobacter fusiformis]
MKLHLLKYGSLPLFFAIGLLGSSCAVNPQPYADLKKAQQSQPAPPDYVSFWIGDSLEGSPSVRISLAKKRAYLYKGDELAGVSLISTGREWTSPATGNFRILEKDAKHRSSLYGDYVNGAGSIVHKNVDTRRDPRPKGTRFVGASMPRFMRIGNGIGLHEGFLPGYPDTHASIGMPAYMAAAFFRTVSVGTPVSIEP